MDCALLAIAEESAPRLALPTRVKALCVAHEAGLCAWLAEALAVDSAAQIVLVESRTAADAVQRVRDEAFDAVLIAHGSAIDAFDLLDALRAAGSDEPALVLGDEPNPELVALALEAGAEAYVSLRSTTTRALIWTLARAIERGELVRENRRLRQADRQRLEAEHQETQRLIDEQRVLIHELETLDAGLLAEAALESAPRVETEPLPRLPDALVDHYHQLLRTHVIMGSGNLSGDIRTLAQLLADAGLGARNAMQLHLQVVETLLRGLGNRSTRHIMARADLLALELVVELAEAFRLRLDEHLRPARQMWLPGFALASHDAA